MRPKFSDKLIAEEDTKVTLFQFLQAAKDSEVNFALPECT